MAEAVEGSTEIMQCSAGLGLFLLAAIAPKTEITVLGEIRPGGLHSYGVLFMGCPL